LLIARQATGTTLAAVWDDRLMTDRYLADHVLPADDAMSLHSPGFVDVAAGRIVATGRVADAPGLDADDTEHRVGGLLMPGLVNDHAHSAMTVLRGAGEGLALEQWLQEAIWPREGRLDAEGVRTGMLLGSAEMLLGGITTSNEMYFHPDAVAAAADEAGLRCRVGVAVVDAPGWERFGPIDAQIHHTVRLRDEWTGSDRIEIAFGPHSAYTLSSDALAEIGRLAVAERIPVHVHVAETRSEQELSRETSGKTVAAYLADLGIFEAPATAAHCVWVDESDIGILAEHGVGVAHCPGSNGKLASGMAPVVALRRAGVAVGISTDGPASNNNLDLWEEATLALLYARLRESDPIALGVPDALRMTTVEAAEALGRTDIGALAPGRWADMIRISLDDLVYDPVLEPGDVLSHLVWAGSSRDVTDVWVAGRQVVADRTCLTVDVERIRAEAREVARRITAG
jgi:5-methylthioadenosine/S-adenosylhomocysteine deaminase